VQNWMQYDQAAAKQWIEQSDLPDNVRTQLLQQVTPPGGAGAVTTRRGTVTW
jgi:hypothetical protein